MEFPILKKICECTCAVPITSVAINSVRMVHFFLGPLLERNMVIQCKTLPLKIKFSSNSIDFEPNSTNVPKETLFCDLKCATSSFVFFAPLNESKNNWITVFQRNNKKTDQMLLASWKGLRLNVC